MSIVEGFFSEIGFFESSCTSIEWISDKLIVHFENGVDVGGSDHPLADSFGVDEPCKIVYEGVIKSRLKVSELISKPNNFDVHYFDKDDLPQKNLQKNYEEFYMEGDMKAIEAKGWFVWGIISERVLFDDLK